MKFIKFLKVIDLIISILFIGLFFYNYRITESHEYGFGQLIEIFFLLPVAFLLLISTVMSVVDICIKNKIYLFSIIGQIIKIVAYLLNFVIIKFWLGLIFEIDCMILIPVYALLILIILLVYKMINDCKKTAINYK